MATAWTHGDIWESECGSVKLYCGDCLEVMPTLEAGSVDAVVTDPPYPNLKGGYRHAFSGVSKTTRETVSVGVPWDAGLSWVDAAKRVCDLGMIIFCSHHSVAEIAEQCQDFRRVALITWYKRNSPPTGKNVPRFTSELVWCFAKKPGLKWDAIATTVYDIPNLQTGCMANERECLSDGSAAHPTQKPVQLMIELLAVSPRTTLDPFMGSGTTGVACVRTGRRFIGIELNPDYFSIAVKRIKQALQDAKCDLFKEQKEEIRHQQSSLFA